MTGSFLPMSRYRLHRHVVGPTGMYLALTGSEWTGILRFAKRRISWLWRPCVADADIVFSSCFFFLLLFFLAESQQSQIGSLRYFYTRCGPSANLECRSEMCCTWLARNAEPNKKPSYRWGTARRGRASWNLVKFCTNVDDLYLKSSETRLLPIRL